MYANCFSTVLIYRIPAGLVPDPPTPLGGSPRHSTPETQWARIPACWPAAERRSKFRTVQLQVLTQFEFCPVFKSKFHMVPPSDSVGWYTIASHAGTEIAPCEDCSRSLSTGSGTRI